MTGLEPSIAQKIFDKIEQHDKSDNIRFSQIDSQLSTIHDDVKDIKDLLKGEPDFKRKGLVEMVDAHENLIKKAAWTMGIIMAIGSLLGFVVSKI